MSYPDLPENRLIVNGVDLAVRYNMVLLDGYTLSPPEPKTTTVEIPGRDGVLDLTESLIGDVTYSNRSMTFTFLIVDLEQFEVVKTQVSNALHGRKFNFEMTMDPGYTYTGRFKVTSYTHTATWNHGICGFIEVEIDAEPYKLKSHYVYNLNATGGAMFNLESGRKKVHPIVEISAPARIRFKNVVYRIGAGRFQLNDILFEEGINEIYINSYELFNLRWDEWKPIGPARIICNTTLDEGEILTILGDFNNWDRQANVMTKDEATGSYFYEFPPSSPYIGQNITYKFMKIPANFEGDIDNLTSVGRNLLKGTKTPKQVTGTNTTNQGAKIYELVPNSWASLEAGQYMLSVDVKYEGVISGAIAFQRDNKPWGFTPAATIDCAESFSDAKRSAHFEFLIDNAYDGASRGLTVRFDNVKGTVTFSNVKLERGTKATAWSPAPEEMLDLATGTNRTIGLTMRSTYTSDWGSSNISVGKINDAATTQWKEWTNVRWDELHKLEGTRIDVHQRWREFHSMSWRNMGKQPWKYWNFHIEDMPEQFVKLEYDWKDL